MSQGSGVLFQVRGEQILRGEQITVDLSPMYKAQNVDCYRKIVKYWRA